MDDHQEVARWAGGLRWQTAEPVDGYLTTARAGRDPIEVAFEEDLAAWLAQLDADRADRRIGRVCVIGWLALMATIVAIPLLGIAAALAAVGVLVTTVLKVWQATSCGTEQFESVQPTEAAGLCAPARPKFGPDERAQLVRLMNLSRACARPAARLLLQAELREARAREPLAHWKPLQDLDEMLRTDRFVFRIMSE